MILQELVRYYDRKARDPDPAQRLPSPGLEDKAIPFIIELAPDGQVLQLIDTRVLEGKKLRAREFLVPLGEKKTFGVKANLLWDSAAYVIGLDTGRRTPLRPARRLPSESALRPCPKRRWPTSAFALCSPPCIATTGPCCIPTRPGPRSPRSTR